MGLFLERFANARLKNSVNGLSTIVFRDTLLNKYYENVLGSFSTV